MSIIPSKSRFTVIPAVYIILKKGDKYLFGKRKNTGFMDGFYQLPSGHIDGQESLKTAMVREAKEEINLTIKESDLDLVFLTHRAVENNLERVDFFFECKIWDESQIKNMEEDKCSELAWLSLDDENIVDFVKEALKRFEKGENYADFGFEG